MDNMENVNVKKHNKTLRTIAFVGIIVIIFTVIIGIYFNEVVLEHAPGKMRDGVLYLNHEDIYVYDSLESALTDTKCQDGPPKPLKEILPDLLKDESLVYLEGTTVGICIDQQITQEEIADESKEDRIIYKINDYFLAESIVQPN